MNNKNNMFEEKLIGGHQVKSQQTLTIFCIYSPNNSKLLANLIILDITWNDKTVKFMEAWNEEDLDSISKFKILTPT